MGWEVPVAVGDSQGWLGAGGGGQPELRCAAERWIDLLQPDSWLDQKRSRAVSSPIMDLEWV